MASCYWINQLVIFPRSKWSIKQVFIYSNITMCHNIVSVFRCFKFLFVIGFTFGLIYLLLNSIPRQLACGCIMWSISIVMYAMQIILFSLRVSTPLPLKFILPLPLQPPLPLEKSWEIFFFLWSSHTASSEYSGVVFFPKSFSL